MLDALKLILEIQELDMKLVQLVDLRSQRRRELAKIKANEEGLCTRAEEKKAEILELKKLIRLAEGEHAEVLEKIKKLEGQQRAIKKVDEYNAITHEISTTDRDRVAKEQRLSDFYDRVAAEEDALKKLNETIETTKQESKEIVKEINENVGQINEEGRAIKKERDALVKKADPEVFKVYERLLSNKKCRVVVPLENRCCSGCHIMLTAQHENLVRRGERLVFCEHCSRIHYWQESKALEDSVVATKQRRRKAAKV